MSEQKKKYVKVKTLPGGAGHISEIDDAKHHVHEWLGLQEVQPGDSIICTVVEMTESEYEQLPEFEGF